MVPLLFKEQGGFILIFLKFSNAYLFASFSLFLFLFLLYFTLQYCIGFGVH